MATPVEETSAVLNNDEAAELVTEFPPPPYYYTQTSELTPPPIPHEALKRASMKAVEEMKRNMEEAERNRLAAEGGGDGIGSGGGDGTGIANNMGFLGGDAPSFEKTAGSNDDEVAVFGEYVEVS